MSLYRILGINSRELRVKDKSELTDIKKEEQDFILLEDQEEYYNGELSTEEWNVKIQ